MKIIEETFQPEDQELATTNQKDLAKLFAGYTKPISMCMCVWRDLLMFMVQE
jgi:hypothetical protein